MGYSNNEQLLLFYQVYMRCLYDWSFSATNNIISVSSIKYT